MPDAAPDRTLDVGSPDQQPPVDSGAPNPLCGQGCDPDDELACVDGASPPHDGGPDAARDGAGGTASDGSPGSEAGPRDSGARRDVEDLPSHACQVRRAGSNRAATCGPAGTGKTGNPCVSSADCAAGLACVGDDKAALCRPYCCNGSEGDASDRDSGTSSCPTGDFCAERPLRDDADSAEPLRVPVCVTAEKCSLFEQYPCPPGPNVPCICPAGTACTVVRNDGTTGCVEPGTGLQGEACPCAAGHYCWKATNKCVKLCSTTPTERACGNGRCQAVSGFPANWGACVGLMGDGG